MTTKVISDLACQMINNRILYPREIYCNVIPRVESAYLVYNYQFLRAEFCGEPAVTMYPHLITG